MAGHVTITLPKDRSQPGALVLRDEQGAALFSAQCLGQGKARHGQLQPRGDTPTGRYGPTFIAHFATRAAGIGKLWCALVADEMFDTPASAAERAGRIGLGIHGGRGDFVLVPTHGSIRLLDRDMADFARAAGKMRFTVEIVEA